MIPNAYVISGIVGIIITTLYARIQNRLPFSSLAILNLIFISVITAILRIAFSFTESKWLIFLIFVMMGPLNIIAMLGFWGAVGRIFTLRQGKRLFGLIDSGQIFGAILSTFAIPVLIALGFQQKNLLFLSSVSILCALVIQLIIAARFNLNKQIEAAPTKQKKLIELLSDKYIFYMALFIVLSVLAAFFIQYSFLSVTKANYPDHDNLTKFLGAFTGSLLLFTFIFKTFVYSKLMKAYGLKISILISSFLLGIFTVFAVLIGTLGGFDASASGFIFFFLIIALSRLFSKALKDSVEVPSFKILYQSLKVEIRHNVQAYVDGTINEIAALSAGLLLAALGMFEFFKLIHFSYALIIILLAWFFVARKLYQYYHISLKKSLAEYKGVRHEVNGISEFVEKNIHKESANQHFLITNLEMDFALHPLQFEKKISSMVKQKNHQILELVVDKITENKIFNVLDGISKPFDSEPDDELKRRYRTLVEKVDVKLDQSPGKEKIIQWAKSKVPDEKIIAAFFIGKYYQNDFFIHLKALLRDMDNQVKIAGIKAAAEIKHPELCPLIIEFLENENTYAYAYDALLLFGEKALPFLDQFFYKTGTSHRSLLRIVKLMGKVGGAKATDYLLKKLNHPNEEILFRVLLALRQCNYRADENSSIKIHQIIERHIGVMAWNIAAQQTLVENDYEGILTNALREEIEANYDLLYLLLSLAYDTKSIMHVKENIESGTTEGISYALELLDLFIDEELKPKLIPLVEDISATEKVKQLQNFYPVGILPLKDLLISIVNRDVNYISNWTKASAIFSFSDLKPDKVPDDIIAHLFNPVELLRETSAIVMYRENREAFNNIRPRIDKQYQDQLDQSITAYQKAANELLIKKTVFLKQTNIFQGVPYRYLCHLAKKLDEINFGSKDKRTFSKNELKNKILFSDSGTFLLTIDQQKSKKLVPGKVCFFNDILTTKSLSVTIERTGSGLIYAMEQKVLIYNMFDYQDIEISVFRWMNPSPEEEVSQDNPVNS
ncbi:MAG: hypothetical protein V2I54_12095 [Bacteroidales bacterium]|nr:hypothetical protein [Bacteroidales bacterium]